MCAKNFLYVLINFDIFRSITPQLRNQYPGMTVQQTKYFSKPHTYLTKSNKITHGFTLLELLCAITIIAILMTFAYPSYASYIARARRQEAKVALIDLASKLEHYHSQHLTYQGANFVKLNSKDETPHGDYELRIDTISKNHYALSAIPLTGQANADKDCGSLQFNSSGQKTVTGNADVKSCWQG